MATITFSSMLRFTAECRERLAHADWLLRNITQGVNADWLSSRECGGKVKIFQLQRKCSAANPRERTCP